MRRIAFLAVVSIGLLACGWLAARPIRDPAPVDLTNASFHQETLELRGLAPIEADDTAPGVLIHNDDALVGDGAPVGGEGGPGYKY